MALGQSRKNTNHLKKAHRNGLLAIARRIAKAHEPRQVDQTRTKGTTHALLKIPPASPLLRKSCAQRSVGKVLHFLPSGSLPNERQTSSREVGNPQQPLPSRWWWLEHSSTLHNRGSTGRLGKPPARSKYYNEAEGMLYCEAGPSGQDSEV